MAKIGDFIENLRLENENNPTFRPGFGLLEDNQYFTWSYVIFALLYMPSLKMQKTITVW